MGSIIITRHGKDELDVPLTTKMRTLNPPTANMGRPATRVHNGSHPGREPRFSPVLVH